MRLLSTHITSHMPEKLSESIKFLNANFLLLSSIVMTVWLPGSILLVYLRLYVFPETVGNDELQILVQEMRVSNLIELALGPIYVGGLLHAASQIKQGLGTTYRQSMAHGARRSFKLLGTRIGTSLIILLGLLLIVPGIILALRFALVDAVVVLENVEGSKARKLSTQMTEGKRWNILGAMILAFIGVMLTFLLINFVLYLLLSFVGQDENFIVAVISECTVNILLLIPTLTLFHFYWDAKHNQNAIQNDC